MCSSQNQWKLASTRKSNCKRLLRFEGTLSESFRRADSIGYILVLNLHTLLPITNFILLFSLHLCWWQKTYELVIPSSLKTSLWGNYPVFQDFSPCWVDGAIFWVFPESIVVFLDPPVLLGITLMALSLAIAFGVEVPTLCGLLISTPVFLQSNKSLRLSGAPRSLWFLDTFASVVGLVCLPKVRDIYFSC